MKAKQTITKFLKVFLVTGLYFSFFAVQLFFNFDLASSPKNYLGSGSFHHQVAGARGFYCFQKTSVSAKANIRLNKRFEPNSVPDCITPVFEVVLFLYLPDNVGCYYNNAIPSTIKSSAFLRGPPAVAVLKKQPQFFT